MRVFVVTRPENGWDCVIGVYKAESEKALKKHLMEEQGKTDEDEFDNRNIIHEETLQKI